jgi:hypothetical protein
MMTCRHHPDGCYNNVAAADTEHGAYRCCAAHWPDPGRSRLRYDLASYLHGPECTCPYSVEADDLERADQWLRTLDDAIASEAAARMKGALDAEELDPGSPWNIAGADR